MENNEKEIIESTENEEVVDAEVVEEVESSEAEANEVVDAEVVSESQSEEQPQINLEDFSGVVNSTRYDYETMMYSNVYIIKYKRKTMLMYGVMLGIVFALGIWNLIVQIQSENPSYIFPIIFLLFAIYMVYTCLNIEKSLDRQLRQFFKNKEVITQTNYINEDEFYVVRGNDAPVKIDWLQIQEIHEIPQYYLLFINPNSPLIISKSEDSFVKGSSSELKAIIDEKAKAKPYKCVDKQIVKKPITYVHDTIIVEKEDEDNKDA